MKNNKKILIITIIIILIIMVVYLLFAKSSNCKKTDNYEEPSITNVGSISNTKKVTSGEIAKILMYISKGDKYYTLNNSVFNNLPLSTMDLVTSINNKSDKSNWLVISIKDIIDYYKMNMAKQIIVYSSNGDFSKEFSSLDNLYLLIKKDNKDISLNGESIFVLANIKEDASNWVYSPNSIIVK